MNRVFKLLKEVKNGRIDPIVHRGAFLVPGLVNYADLKAGICLLKKESIDSMLNSIKGIPVVIGHPNEPITNDNIKKLQNGVVIDGFYNEKTGEFEAYFITNTAEAEELVNSGYSLSVAYNEIQLGPGGTHHAIPYKAEILNGKFTHLALVEARKARYEEAYIDTGIKIFQNSVGEGTIWKDKPKQEDKKMKFTFKFPFINSKTQEVDTEKACVVIGDKQVSVKELVNAYNKKIEAGLVEVEGDREFAIVNAKGENETVTAQQLIDAYNATEKDEDEEEKKKTAKEEEDFVNSLDEKEKEEYSKLDKAEAKNAFKNKKKEMKNNIVNLPENALVQIKNSKGELKTIGIKDLVSSFCAHEEAGRNIGTFSFINSKGKAGEVPAELKNAVKNDGTTSSGAKKGKEYFKSGKFAK